MTTARPAIVLVRAALGRKATQLSDAAVEALAREFVRAGRAALGARVGGAPAAAAAVRFAAWLRRAGLKRLADVTRPGVPAVLHDRQFADPLAAMESTAARLGERHGAVRGVAVSHRRRGGHRVEEPVLTVMVGKKHNHATLQRRSMKKLPKTVRAPSGRRVAVDVVEIGRMELQVLAGESLGPAGNAVLKGTIGAFGVEVASQRVVALTAGHVAKVVGSYVTPAHAVSAGGQPLGSRLSSTMQGVDAGLIALDAPGDAVHEWPDIGPIHGWRPLLDPEDRDAPVRLFGATSGFREGAIIEPGIALPAAGLTVAVLADIMTLAGDSGCGLVDDQGLLLALLKGRMKFNGRPVAVFSPIAEVLKRLGADI